jgi:PadR family transcriptional regulator, regulatory protein PadR
MINRELATSFVRMHVLHHASHKPVFGVWLIEELREHGYKVGPGTLYPILHSMEDTGLLRSKHVVVNGKRRRVYEITTAGKRALQRGKTRVRELYDELFDEKPDDAGRPARRGSTR